MSLRTPRAQRRRRVTLDISALIDVVFLLLIFFAVTTTFLEQPGIELTLPESSSAETTPPQQIRLFVGPDGKLFLGDQPVSLENLKRELKEQLAKRNKKEVILSADTKTQHGIIVKVMDAARQAGATGLAIATEPE